MPGGPEARHPVQKGRIAVSTPLGEPGPPLQRDCGVLAGYDLVAREASRQKLTQMNVTGLGPVEQSPVDDIPLLNWRQRRRTFRRDGTGRMWAADSNGTVEPVNPAALSPLGRSFRRSPHADRIGAVLGDQAPIRTVANRTWQASTNTLRFDQPHEDSFREGDLFRPGSPGQWCSAE